MGGRERRVTEGNERRSGERRKGSKMLISKASRAEVARVGA